MRLICLFGCLSCICAGAASEHFTYTKVIGVPGEDGSPGNVVPLDGGTSCLVCYGDSKCWRADSAFARCDYLAETSKILPEEEAEEDDQGTGARIEVMDALGALMSKAASDDRYQECIPHVSEYTNCHHGNICLGCRRCSCTMEGFWTCRQVKQCRPDLQVEIEDEILNLVMDKLNALYSSALATRKKRSFRTRLRITPSKYMNSAMPKPVRLSAGVTDSTSTSQYPTTTFQQQKVNNATDRPKKNDSKDVTANFAQTPFFDKENELLLMTDDMFKEIKSNLSVSSETITPTTKKSDLDFNFDDLLDNTSNDNHQAPHTQLFDDKSFAAPSKKMYDVGDLLKTVHDIYNPEDATETESLQKQNHFLETTTLSDVYYDGILASIPIVHGYKLPIKDQKKILQTYLSKNKTDTWSQKDKSQSQMDIHQNDYMDMSVSGKFLGPNDFSNAIVNETDYNDFDEPNYVNIMKRDTNFVDRTPEDVNSTQTFQNLDENVLQPLNNIINEKQHEIQDLKKVRERLVDYLRSYTKNNISLNTNKTELIEESKQFAVYQLAINPQIMDENTEVVETISEFRRSETDRREKQNQTIKYVRKLKRDIFEILRDIIAIKKITNTEEPHELKLLTRALKFYIRAQTKKRNGFAQDKELLSWWNNQDKTRRLNSNQPSTYIQDGLTQIFQILEKNTLQGNPLYSLSRETSKIIKRIIKNLAGKDSKESTSWIEISEPHYNVTGDLSIFTENFTRSVEEVKNASIFDIIDKMKMLHLELNIYSNRLRGEMFLVKNNNNRRSQHEVEKHLESTLRAIKRDVDNTKKYISRMFVDLDTSNYLKGYGKSRSNINVIPKKESFMRYLKKLISKSKNSMLGIMHRAAPHKDSNLELITLNRLMDYEKIMRRWQNDLEVTPKRRKRFVRRINNAGRSELKHILPKYLSGKVGPTIIARVKANRIKQRRYYVDRDETFYNQRDEDNDINTRNMKGADDFNSNPSEVPADSNTVQSFMVMAPKKEGVRTKIEENIPYPPSDRVLDFII